MLRGFSFWTLVIKIAQVLVYLLGLGLLFWFGQKFFNSYTTHIWPPIEKLSAWAQIVIAYAAIFAIGQYAVAYADIADRKTKTVLELVKFFRETVLGSAAEIKSYFKNEKINLPLALRLTKNTPLLKFTADEFFNRIAPNQKELIENYKKLLADDFKFEAFILDCLNSIEEFSIGILNTRSTNHKAVASIKKPFVEMIEGFAIPLYYQIGDNADEFSYTVKLYKYWKTDVGYVPLNKNDKLERYEERKKRYYKGK